MAQIDLNALLALANSLIELVMQIRIAAQQAGASGAQLHALDAKLTAAINARIADLEG